MVILLFYSLAGSLGLLAFRTRRKKLRSRLCRLKKTSHSIKERPTVPVRIATMSLQLSILLSRSKYFLKRCFGYFGPGYLIAIGYMDPGNWQTDIESGSTFAYQLLWIILLSNFMAMLLQFLAIRLGVLGRVDLAKACALQFNPSHYRGGPQKVLIASVKWSLYVLAELAMMATDLAEVIGTAIALKMLFGLPLIYGVLLTAFDVIFLLTGILDTATIRKDISRGASTSEIGPMEDPDKIVSLPAIEPKFNGAKLIEIIILILMSIISICFFTLMVLIRPSFIGILQGMFFPDVPLLWQDSRALFLALGIIGATVMPHNLYLHSSIVQARIPRELERMQERQMQISATERQSSMQGLRSSSQRPLPLDGTCIFSEPTPNYYRAAMNNAVKYATIDSTVALFIALLINAAIMITAAGGLNVHGEYHVGDIIDAGNLLAKYFGPAACTLFAVALLACGQSSTMTGTLAGQIVFEGFLDLEIRPWVRRLITRGAAIIPPIIVTFVLGEDALNELILVSQVILSFQLPFAIIPLIWFNWNGAFLVRQSEEQRALLSGSLTPLESTNSDSMYSENVVSYTENVLMPHEMATITVATEPKLNRVVFCVSIGIAGLIVALNFLYLIRIAIYGAS